MHTHQQASDAVAVIGSRPLPSGAAGSKTDVTGRIWRKDPCASPATASYTLQGNGRVGALAVMAGASSASTCVTRWGARTPNDT
jgi:hypothetical protein